MSGTNREITATDVLDVFETMTDPREPLSTSEVAARLDCNRRTAYDVLERLSERGALESKAIGARARAWWRPSAQDGQQPPASDTIVSAQIERILEASPVSIVVVEPTGTIIFANDRATETLGLERSAITGRTYRQPEWNIYDDDGTPVPDDEHPVTRVLETSEPHYGFEHWIRLSDGTERWLSSNSAPVLDANGDVEYVVVGFEDATPLKEREDKLTSDEWRILEFSSHQLLDPFLEAADGEIQVDLEQFVPLSDGTAMQYVTATGDITPRAFIDVFEADFDALDVRLLQSTSEHCRLEVHVRSPGLANIFAQLGGRLESYARSDAEGTPVCIAQLPGDVSPRTAIQRARTLYPDSELQSQYLRYTPRLLHDIVADALTDRQFAALQMAYYGGYFDSPRNSTGDELAEQLGVTRQTFNQHLRRAEQIAFEKLFEASGRDAR